MGSTRPGNNICQDMSRDLHVRSLAHITSKPVSSTSSRAGNGKTALGCRNRHLVYSGKSSSMVSAGKSGGGRRISFLELLSTSSCWPWHA
eukprot:7581643-Pyramimonas_sp.AAC.1